MITGLNNKKMYLLRHVSVATLSALLVYFFYLSYFAWGVEPALWPDWGMDHPFWRAWAHAAFVLLFLILILSPAAILWKPLKRFIPWRRELGIWFAILSFGHGYAIWDRWARWDVPTLFGFGYVEDFGSYVLFRPEVGIMNMMGLVMAPLIILLALTSFDKAVTFLGPSSWKWFHSTLVPVIFYLAMLRGVLYLFYFFQVNPPEWNPYPPIWFLYVFLGMGLFAVILQAAAFVKTVLQRKRRNQKNSILQTVFVIGTGILFVMPMALMTVAVAYFDHGGIKEPPGTAEETPSSQESVQSFEMVIDHEDQKIHIWAVDIDRAPYIRITTEVEGEPISHQIYKYSERELYTAEPDEDMELVWSTLNNIEPDDMGITAMVRQPRTWAEQFGPGVHQIDVNEAALQVTIHSVEESIDAEVFKIAEVP